MAEEKIYTPAVIQETPFPNQVIVPSNQTQQSGDVSSAIQTTPQPFKKKIISHETVGQALNTLSRKILGVFEFIQQGAIKIGNFEEGETGEIDISPSGIVAKDRNGDISFALDGETGDATFKGRITGGSLNINNNLMVDDEGNVIANSIALVQSNVIEAVGLGQSITSTTAVDITGTSISLTLENPTILLLLANANFKLIQDPFDGLAWSSTGVIAINVDGDEKNVQMWFDGGLDTGTFDGIQGYGNNSHSGTTHAVVTLQPGNHTIKLQAYLVDKVNNPSLYIRDCKLSVVTLGSPLP